MACVFGKLGPDTITLTLSRQRRAAVRPCRLRTMDAPTAMSIDRGENPDDDDVGAAKEDDESEGPTKKQRGGRREDEFGNSLAGRKPNALTHGTSARGSGPLFDCFREQMRNGPKAKKKREREHAPTNEGAAAGAIAASDAPPLPVDTTGDTELADADAAVESAGADSTGVEQRDVGPNSLESAAPRGATETDGLREFDAAADVLERRLRDLSLSIVARVEQAASDALQRITSAASGGSSEVISEIHQARHEAAGKIAEMQRLLQAHSQLDVLSSEHTAVLASGKVFCVTCTENVACLRDGRQLASKWLASKGGFNQDSNLVKEFNRHMGSDMHAACQQANADKQAQPLPTAAAMELQRRDEVMKRLFRTMAHVDKHKLSHRAFEREVVLLHLTGVDVGDCEHSRTTGREMSMLMFEHGRGQVGDAI